MEDNMSTRKSTNYGFEMILEVRCWINNQVGDENIRDKLDGIPEGRNRGY